MNLRWRALLIYGSFSAAFLSLSIYLLWSLRSMLLPIIVGCLLAYICKPLVRQFKVSWMPNFMKVVVVLVGIVGAIAFSTQYIRSMIPSSDERLVLQVRLQYKINEKFRSVMGIQEKGKSSSVLYKHLKGEIDPFMINLNQLLGLNSEQEKRWLALQEEGAISAKYFSYFESNKKLMRQQKRAMEQQKSRAPASEEATEMNKHSLLVSLLNTLSTWLILPFVFIFLLFDQGQISKFFISLIPNNFFEMGLRIIDEVDIAIGNYLRGTILECALVGLSLSSGLFLIGFEPDVALAIGAVAGLTNAIPFLGPAIGLAVGLGYGLILEEISPVLSFINLDNLFLAIFFCVLIAQVLDNIVFQPFVLGGAVDLHPLVVVLGVMGGSVLFGFAGMLLAIPGIVIFKVIISTLFKELKAYRIL